MSTLRIDAPHLAFSCLHITHEGLGFVLADCVQVFASLGLFGLVRPTGFASVEL